MTEASYSFNGCRFDDADGRLWGPGASESVTLRPQAARLLVAFLERPGQVLDRKHLRSVIWDEGTVVDFESGLAALMRELRQALDQLGVDAGLIETVPRRGYRFLGQVDQAAPVVPETTRPVRPRLVGLPLIGLLLLAALVIGVAAWLLIPDKDPKPSALPTLAIIPFELYSDDEQSDRSLRLLLADSILARLWQVELTELELIGRAALKPYQGREDQAAAVASDLGVNLVLEGSIIRPANDQWQVDARLLTMPKGTVLWSASVQWDERPELPINPTVEDLVEALAAAWPGIRSDLRNTSE